MNISSFLILFLFLRHPAPSTPKNSEVKLSCRRVPSNKRIPIFGYIMIGSCPSSWRNTETARACMSTNHTADPAVILPLLEVTTNVTYANIYCAMCHGKSHDLRYWSLQIQKGRSPFNISLQDVRSTKASWEAIPVGHTIPEKCVVTPPEANNGPDTTVKRLCRSYSNRILLKINGMKTRVGGDKNHKKSNFKNPHCALLSNPDLLANQTVLCGMSDRVPPRFPSMLFVFSTDGKSDSPHSTAITVHVKFNCEINEVYDPFQERCLPVHSSNTNSTSSHTNVTHECQGIRFPPHKFYMFTNNSVFVIPHQNLYNNDSFILINQTLILCANFSRNYTRQSSTSGVENESLSSHSLALRIVTYVGFSLSIISLLILLVTYFLFAELRTYPGKKVMHLSCAIIAMQTVYFVSDPEFVAAAVCSVLGALLHYFILVMFLWMSVIARSTQKTFSNLRK